MTALHGVRPRAQAFAHIAKAGARVDADCPIYRDAAVCLPIEAPEFGTNPPDALQRAEPISNNASFTNAFRSLARCPMVDPQNNRFPNWLLWVMARPIVMIVAFALLVVGIPAGVAVYLDQRIAGLADHNEVRPRNEPSGAEPAALPLDVLVGQTVYVPLYSHVYQGSGERLLLAGTLSIRNTDSDHSLTISAVRYYDTEGKMVRDFLPTPLKLKPMGSTDFLVKEADTTGGAGANFIVEWVSDEPVHEPIVEAVMVGRRGGSVTAFVRPGVVTKQLRPKK